MTSADHHNQFYAYIGISLETFIVEQKNGWWRAASNFPMYCPSDGNPQNLVVTEEPNGDLKCRRSANFSYPHDKARDQYTARTGREAPLAYNADRRDEADFDLAARYELATKHDLGQTAIALWDLGVHIEITVADKRSFFRTFTNAPERQALCSTFTGTGWSTGSRGDYGPFDKPSVTGRGGDFIVALTDYVHAVESSKIKWPAEVQDRLDRRAKALGPHHARTSKSGMFVDDIFNLTAVDSDRILCEFSEWWFTEGCCKRTGFESATEKLQSGSAVADWIGFTWNLEKPFDGKHRLMEHKRAKYVAQLEWAVKPDRHWVDEDTVAQINGRLIHSASVHVDIILEMGPLFRWQHHRLHLDNPKLRHRDKHALRSLQLILAIMTANAWQPIFPPVRRPLIDDPHLALGLSDARKPGQDGAIPGEEYCIGFWTYFQGVGILYGIVELTTTEQDLPIPVLEFLGILWCFEACWPALKAAGATAYRGITDSETCYRKSFGNRSKETPMEVVHRRFDRATKFECPADLDYSRREDNAISDGLTHGREKFPAFIAMLDHEDFDVGTVEEVDYSRLSRDIGDVMQAHERQQRMQAQTARRRARASGVTTAGSSSA